jgi:hypothetical protein
MTNLGLSTTYPSELLALIVTQKCRLQQRFLSIKFLTSQKYRPNLVRLASPMMEQRSCGV